MVAMLEVKGLQKTYFQGRFNRTPSFQLSADLTIGKPSIVGMMGPNGSGKTTLFELITGSNAPTAGEVNIQGKNIHKIRTDQRDRLAIHYHQSYQVRSFRSLKPNVLMEQAGSDYPMVHLFDEPQFNTQDGYIGFMLDFFRKLRAEGRMVFLCVHPNERFHLEILQEICSMSGTFEKGAFPLPVEPDQIKALWQAEGFSFGTFRDPPGQEWNNFAHDTDEYVLVAQGTLTVSVADEVSRCDAGDLVRIPRGAVHSLRTTSAKGSVWHYGYGHWKGK
jgi:ABC-type branched-subunit amino acid transport system ATPase component